MNMLPPPPQVTPQALATLEQLLRGMLPKQRQIELIRHQGVIAGAEIIEPDGSVRHVAFHRGADGRISGATPIGGAGRPMAAGDRGFGPSEGNAFADSERPIRKSTPQGPAWAQ
jgi:hypothetical protein